MSVDEFSLPPSVAGVTKGQLEFSVTNIRWDLAGSPSSTQLRLRWWGANEKNDFVVPLAPDLGEGFTVPIKSGPAHFGCYLCDMSTLELLVEDRLKARVVGTAMVDVRTLANDSVNGSYPILAVGNGRCLGKLDVSIRVFFQNISSFELAEHQAATGALPQLAPATSVKPPAARGVAQDVGQADDLEVEDFLDSVEARKGARQAGTKQGRPNAERDHQKFDIFALLQQAFIRCAPDTEHPLWLVLNC